MSDLLPARIVHADLADGLPRLDGGDAHEIVLTLWWRELPLGTVALPAGGVPARVLAERIAAAIARPVAGRVGGAGFEGADPAAGVPLPDSPPSVEALLALEDPLGRLAATAPPDAPDTAQVSAAICTRARPDDLARCLASIAAGAPGPGEVLVIDNAPSPATRAVAERAGARWIAEPRPGLSAARNRALREAAGAVLAFVDDDVEVHPGWLGPLVAPFADPAVAATTGLVLPAELETSAQLRFERVLGGFARGFERLRYGPGFVRPADGSAPAVWKIGAGANMAVRTSALRAVGLYDERLGAGAAGCSEDSELWYRLLAAGSDCRYEPASVAFHHHRRDEAALAHQAHEYLRGHVAALFVQYARHRRRGDLGRALHELPAWLARSALAELWRAGVRRLHATPAQPARPMRAELRGYLRGLAYLPLVRSATLPGGKAPLGAFLRQNPFPHPWTEGFFYREKMRAIHRVAPDAVVRDVLEVGGGRSGMARLLYPGARITTIDLDPAHGDAPVNQDPDVRFVVGDATALPFDDDAFDVVTMFDLLEHVPDDAAAAREAQRVVRPGGAILISTPNERWRSPYHRLMRPLCPGDAEMMERWGHVRRGYTHGDLARLFGAAPDARAEFINPVTAVGHDLGFAKLPGRVRRGLAALLLPVTWLGYVLQRPGDRGTETAASWRRPSA
jgi:GT2 family glycosyltransferase/SAM-dependent methyltransferase